MEYIVGPLIGLLLGMKFTDYSTKKRQAEINALETRIETVETDTAKIDKEILAKSLQIITPIAQATKRLQDAVGVK